MTDKHERLLKLDNDKLIDVVKNYRQYGYDDRLRETAISILADSGIDKEQLQISGNLENKNYDYANDLYVSFQKNSRTAFVLYIVFFALRVLFLIFLDDSVEFVWTFIIATTLSFILYLVFLIMSFINQNQFYKTIGQEYGAGGALLYLFLGMPFYIFMYFYFRNQMKDKMKEIK